MFALPCLAVCVQMLAAGLQPNLVTYNTLLEVYAKRGMWREAVGVLDTLEQQVSTHTHTHTLSLSCMVCRHPVEFGEIPGMPYLSAALHVCPPHVSKHTLHTQCAAAYRSAAGTSSVHQCLCPDSLG